MWITKKKPILALAPMADMTDSPFCTICREVAGKDFVIFREMVSAEAIVRKSEKTLKMASFDKVERPIVLQIFGSNPEVMVEASKVLVKKYDPDGIDINMGCPVPKITGKKSNSGAALLKDHERAVEIVKAVKRANSGVVVSVKTRLGWSDEKDILEFAPKLEKAGADAITLHGRTRSQGYSGKANWEMIGKVKERISIPLIANGDVSSEDHMARCLKVTKADGVMIGRGALGNPWIFNPSLKKDLEDIKKVVLVHAQLHLEHYGQDLCTFRKHLVYYFKGMEGVKEIRKELVKVKTIDDLSGVLSSF